jgi:hypothetical protein
MRDQFAPHDPLPCCTYRVSTHERRDAKRVNVHKLFTGCLQETVTGELQSPVAH